MSSMTDLSVSASRWVCLGWHTLSFPKDAGSLPTVFGMQLEVDVNNDLFKMSTESWDPDYNCFLFVKITQRLALSEFRKKKYK